MQSGVGVETEVQLAEVGQLQGRHQGTHPGHVRAREHQRGKAREAWGYDRGREGWRAHAIAGNVKHREVGELLREVGHEMPRGYEVVVQTDLLEAGDHGGHFALGRRGWEGRGY